MSSMTEVDWIQQNIRAILVRLREYEKKYQRETNSVKLLLASKTQSVEKIQAAIAAGQTTFGENYLQEALEKITALNDSQLEWHFIGPIQSNKTKKIAEHFSWVQSVDSFKIAQRLNNQRPPHLPALNICLEVNVSGEVTKSGVAPNEVSSLAKECLQLPRLKLRGLMTIPELTTDFAKQCAPLQTLKKLYDDLNQQDFKLDTLSMGMSDDLEAAVASGTTMVRVGTAIFGKRK